MNPVIFMAYLLKLGQYERSVSFEAQLELSLNCSKFDDQINMNGHECHNALFNSAVYGISIFLLPFYQSY